jgi:hypothetical protein
MAKDPVKSLDQIIKELVPKVQKVVDAHSKRLWDRAVSRHLTGGPAPTAWPGAPGRWPAPPGP